MASPFCHRHHSGPRPAQGLLPMSVCSSYLSLITALCFLRMVSHSHWQRGCAARVASPQSPILRPSKSQATNDFSMCKENGNINPQSGSICHNLNWPLRGPEKGSTSQKVPARGSCLPPSPIRIIRARGLFLKRDFSLPPQYRTHHPTEPGLVLIVQHRAGLHVKRGFF